MEVDKEKLVEDNLKLVPYVYNLNYKYFSSYPQYRDDLLSIGNLGLIKATSSFDSNKGIKFSSYAITVIRNEMLMFLRKESKHNRELNESSLILLDKDGENFSPMDIIPGEDIFQILEESESNDEIFEKVMILYFTKFTNTQRLVFDKWMSGSGQKDSASEIGIAQSHVSRVRTKICKIIKDNIDKMRVTSSPNAPHRSDYDNFSEYSRDYQRYHYLKSRGRESEFTPFYGVNRGKPSTISDPTTVTMPESVKDPVEMGVIDKPNNNSNTIFEVGSDNSDNSPKSFEGVIKLLDDLEKEYISKIKKIRLAKQSLTSVLDLYK